MPIGEDEMYALFGTGLKTVKGLAPSPCHHSSEGMNNGGNILGEQTLRKFAAIFSNLCGCVSECVIGVLADFLAARDDCHSGSQLMKQVCCDCRDKVAPDRRHRVIRPAVAAHRAPV
ncbi:MAG: hypothetical protein KGI68_01275 [Alphaproteobacteria bacterium]|nr:hypothetical protein [Alphaproteobacteria bacterium]